jgi:hypothetical protein
VSRPLSYRGHYNAMQVRIAELEAENVLLRQALAEDADKKRLDWLQEKGSITIECNMDDLYAVGHPDLRLAIDAARTQEKL